MPYGVFASAASGSFYRAGMKAATAYIADAVRMVAEAMPSKKIPPSVRSYMRGAFGYVGAGGPGGRQAPNAYMFETKGARHPFFAPVGSWRYLHHPWYTQPYRPFMEVAADLSVEGAAEILKEVWGYPYAESLGFDAPAASVIPNLNVETIRITTTFIPSRSGL